MLDAVTVIQVWGLEHWGDRGDRASKGRVRSWLHEHGRWDLVCDALQAAVAVRDVLWDGGVSTLECDGEVQACVANAGAGAAAAIAEGTRVGWGLPMPMAAEGAASVTANRLGVPKDDERWAASFLRSHTRGRNGNGGSGGGASWIGASPVASLELKRWPVERLAAVLDRVLDAHPEMGVLLMVGRETELGAGGAGGDATCSEGDDGRGVAAAAGGGTAVEVPPVAGQ